MIYIRVYEAISTHTTATVVGFFSFKILDNRGRNSLICKRLELTPNFKRRKKKVKAEPDGFNKVLTLVKEKGFKNTHEAIAHYGGVQQFKQAIRQ